MWADGDVLNVGIHVLTSWNLVHVFFINRKKAEEEERLRKEAEAEAAAQIAELDRQLKVRRWYTPLLVLIQCDYSNRATLKKNEPIKT